MITTERYIGIPIRIFTRNINQLDETVRHIKEDFIAVVKHYSDENSEEIQVHLTEENRCSRCGRIWPECVCGKPNRSPAV